MLDMQKESDAHKIKASLLIQTRYRFVRKVRNIVYIQRFVRQLWYIRQMEYERNIAEVLEGLSACELQELHAQLERACGTELVSES